MDLRSKVKGILVPPDKSGALTVDGEWRYDPATGAMLYRDGVAGVDRTVIDTAYVQPQVRAYNSANISVANGLLVALTFDSERFDLGTATEQHSTSSNTGRLTCRTAGIYQIGFTVQYAANATGTRDTLIRLNGATYIARDTRSAASAGTTGVTIITLYRLAVNDYVEAVVFHNITGGGNLNVESAANYSPEFSFTRLSA